MKKILFVVGTRPNFVKLFALLKAFKNTENKLEIIHTGQHYDKELSTIFFKEFSFPKIHNLGITSKDRIIQTKEIINKLLPYLNSFSSFAIPIF